MCNERPKNESPKIEKKRDLSKKVRNTFLALVAAFLLNAPEKLGSGTGDIFDRLGQLINVVKFSPRQLETFIKLNGAEFYAERSGMSMTAELLRQMTYSRNSIVDISDLYRSTILNNIRLNPKTFGLTEGSVNEISDDDLLIYYLQDFVIPSAFKSISVEVFEDNSDYKIMFTIQGTSRLIEDLKNSLNYYRIILTASEFQQDGNNYSLKGITLRVEDTYDWSATEEDISARQSYYHLMVSLFGYEVVEGWHIDFKNHLMSTFVDLRDVDIHEFVEEGFGTSFTVRAAITFPPDTLIEINTDN